MEAIGNIGIPPSPAAALAAPPLPGNAAESGKPGFQELLLKSLEQTNALDLGAQTAIENSLVGDELTQVEAMTAVKKAELSLKMMLQIRNKLLEAYNELQQMRF